MRPRARWACQLVPYLLLGERSPKRGSLHAFSAVVGGARLSSALPRTRSEPSSLKSSQHSLALCSNVLTVDALFFTPADASSRFLSSRVLFRAAS